MVLACWSDTSSASRWTVGLIAARYPSSPRHCWGVAADAVYGVQYELADGRSRGGSGLPCADQPIELFLEILVEVGDELLFGLKTDADAQDGIALLRESHDELHTQ
jgi:hypothetical protein